MSKPRILCNGCGRSYRRTSKGLPHAHGGMPGTPCRTPTAANQQILHPVHRPGFPVGYRITLVIRLDQMADRVASLQWDAAHQRWALYSPAMNHSQFYTDDQVCRFISDGWYAARP